MKLRLVSVSSSSAIAFTPYIFLVFVIVSLWRGCWRTRVKIKHGLVLTCTNLVAVIGVLAAHLQYTLSSKVVAEEKMCQICTGLRLREQRLFMRKGG